MKILKLLIYFSHYCNVLLYETLPNYLIACELKKKNNKKPNFQMREELFKLKPNQLKINFVSIFS